MTPKAVIFDIGNVLINWQPEEYYDAQIGEARRRAMFEAVDLHHMNDLVDQGHNFTEMVTQTAAKYPDWSDEIMMWHDRWIDMATPAIDHSVRLKTQLQAKGVPVFSLTNFGIDTYEIAEQKYPFLRDFDRNFISGHMKVVKPNPRIYEMVEQGSGLSGAELLFTDDRPENIAAAEQRGWQVHHFEGPQGWADRLVSEGLLSSEEAQ